MNMKRPKIICQMMTSVDGRLLRERWTPFYDGSSELEISRVYAEAEAALGTQARMWGKRTVQQRYFSDVFSHEGRAPASDFSSYCAPGESARLLVVADPDGEITYTYGTVGGDRIVTVTGR